MRFPAGRQLPPPSPTSGLHWRSKTRITSGMRFIPVICTALAVTFATSPAVAHSDAHVAIEGATATMRRDGESAEALTIRGELHLAADHPKSALRDFDHALKLEPLPAKAEVAAGPSQPLRAAVGRVAALLRLNGHTEAQAETDKLVQLFPNHTEPLLARALVSEQRRRPADAAADLAAAARLSSQPDPDLYQRQAALLMQAHPPRSAEAVAALDEGIARLGPIISLQEFAVDIESRAGLHEAALARVEAILASVPASAHQRWLVRRAAILEAAGRGHEAHASYGEAIGLLEDLPPRQRHTSATREITLAAEEGYERTK